MIAGLLLAFALVMGAILPSIPWFQDPQPAQPKRNFPAATAATTTAESSASVDSTGTHNPTEAACVTCHLRPASHQFNAYKCVECHEYDDWHTAAHPDGSNCATCHSAPRGHYGRDCATCHEPTTPWADTQMVHNSTTQSCQRCHARPHRAYPAARCLECHTQAGVRWTPTAHPQSRACASCHKAPHRGYRPSACTECHRTTPGSSWTPVRHTTRTDCASCHSAKHPVAGVVSCATCHKGTTDLLTTHASSACATCHASTSPKVVAAIAAGGATCTSCHDLAAHGHTTRTDCVTCHTATAPADHYGDNCTQCHVPGPAWVFTHTTDKTADCLSCHERFHPGYDPSICSDCHPQVGVIWSPVEHVTRLDCENCHYPRNPHAETGCATCHLSRDTWEATGHPDATSDCVTCHATTAPADHYGDTCNQCHLPGTAWVFTHTTDKTADCLSCHEPFHPSYDPSICSDCHPQVGVIWSPVEHVTRLDCENCHYPRNPHAETGCATCHLSRDTWEATAHPDATSDCATCHTAPHASHAPTTCVECHAQPGVAWLPIKHPPESSDCFSCHPDYPLAHVTNVCVNCHYDGEGFTFDWGNEEHPFDTTCNMAGCHSTGPSAPAARPAVIGTAEASESAVVTSAPKAPDSVTTTQTPAPGEKVTVPDVPDAPAVPVEVAPSEPTVVLVEPSEPVTDTP